MRRVNLPVAVAKIVKTQDSEGSVGERALQTLLELIDRRPYQVFYEQQLQVLCESLWSHKSTTNALRALVKSDSIQTHMERFTGTPGVRFFWSNALPDAEADKGMEKRLIFIRWSSSGNVGRRIGAHAEKLVVAAFKSIEGTVLSVDSNGYEGRVSQMDGKLRLDVWVCVNGETFGVEVKNMLDFPNAREIELKSQLAEALGTRPVLVTRAAPASWDEEFQKRGGFIWRLGRQLFPTSRAKVARSLHAQSGLPIEACDALGKEDCDTLRQLVMRCSALPAAA
jgi:hypothetical protein